MTIAEDLENQFKEAFKFPDYVIQIGVVEADTVRKIDKVRATKTKKTDEKSITNAQLMYIHENGSYLHHIPKRPVLEMTLKWTDKGSMNKAIDKAFMAYLKSGKKIDFSKSLQRYCLSQVEVYARDLIYNNDGRLVANSPRTIAMKGFNHPLFQTGQLARSITCRLIELNGG